MSGATGMKTREHGFYKAQLSRDGWIQTHPLLWCKGMRISPNETRPLDLSYIEEACD